MMQEQNDKSAREVTIERTFDAPRKLVWEAWTEPGHIAKWWGPKGMATEVVEHDLQPGGRWKYVMAMPNGHDFVAEGKYLEIVEFEKLVTEADFKPMTEGVILTVLLKDAGEKTHFSFTVTHATAEYCEQQKKMGFEKGWGSTFDRLAELLTAG